MMPYDMRPARPVWPGGAPLLLVGTIASAAPATPDPLVAYIRQGIVAADTDHDGRVSRAEFVAARRSSTQPGKDPTRGFAEMDANRDGYLSAAEIDAAIARRMTKPVQTALPR